MLTVDALRAWGANVDEGIARCVNNEAFYLRMVSKVQENLSSCDEIREAAEAGELDRAFESAHALKGVLGNLSLTPLYEPVAEITELLRARTAMDYSALTAKIVAKKEELNELIG